MKKKLQFLFSMVVLMCASVAVHAQVDITDDYLTNANLSTKDTGWDYYSDAYKYEDWLTGGGNEEVPVVEFYSKWNEGNPVSMERKDFKFSQTITLPAGEYRIAVNAFYRNGSGDGTNEDKAWIFAGEKKQNVVALSSAGVGSYTGDKDINKAANAFFLGDFSNAFDFTLEETTTLDVGFQGFFNLTLSWCILGPMKLYKYSLDAYQADYRKAVADAEALYDKPMDATVLQAMKDAVVEESAITTSAEFQVAIQKLNIAISEANNSIAEYAKVKATIDENAAKVAELDEAGQAAYDISAIEAAYTNGSLESDAINALSAAFIVAKKAQRTVGADLTEIIANAAGNAQVGDDNWKVENELADGEKFQMDSWAGTASGIECPMIEYWHVAGTSISTNTIYQTITGLIPGATYRFTATTAVNNENKETPAEGSALIFANESTTDITIDGETTPHNGVMGTFNVEGVVGEDGELKVGFMTVNPNYNWIAFKNTKLTLVDLPHDNTYTVAIAEGIENGTVEATPAEAVEGETVTLTITPAEGYELEAVTVKDAEENDVEVSEEYTFIMPATAVTVAATFAKVAEPEPDYADVKLTYVDGNEDTADTAYGEVSEAVIGYNKIANGTVALANAGWGVNKIGYVKVDASKFNGTITSAKMTAEVSGCDGKRTAGWGVGYNNSEWSADLTYNTADKSITQVGTEYWTTTTAADVFEPVEFDITEAFAEGNVANILVYELAAAGGTIKNIKVAVEYIPGAPKLANRTFDENPDDVIKVTTQGYQKNVKDDQVSGMQPVTDWTPNNIQTAGDPGYTGAIFAYGSENKLNDKVAAPAEAPEGSESTSALGLLAVWEGIAQYTQAVTLPSGDYKMTYTAYNGANTGNITKNLFGFIAEDGTEYLSETKSFTVGEWNTYEIAFTIEEETKGNISVGFIGSGGSGNAPHLFVDNVTLEKVLGVELALVDLKKAIEEAEATVSTYPVGDALFQYAEAEITPLTEAIATAQAAYEAAESKEAVEAATETLNAFVADFAPKATTPDAEKQYTLKNKQADLYMTLSEEGISIAEEPCALTFEATDGGKYYLTDGEYYVGLVSTDNYSMSSAADKKEALAISCTVVEGVAYYTLGESKGMVGVDYPVKDNMGCWADKGTNAGDAVLWTIEEYVAPPVPAIVLNAPTFSAEEGTQAEPTMLAADETLKITYTADNLEENGLTADDVKVKVTVLVTGDLPENMMVMGGSTTAHRVMSETFYIPLGEADFPVALKEGYVYQNIAVMAADLVKPETEEAAEETLAAYAGAPVQLHWIGVTATEPEPIDPDLIEIAQDQGKELDTFTRTDLEEGEDYNTYTAHGDLNIAMKMMNVDVADCDYVVVKFAEPVEAGWKLAFWSDQNLVDVPEGATEYKYVFAEDPECDVVDGVLPQICMMTFFNAPETLVAKVFGVYKHKVTELPNSISGIDAAKAKGNGKYLQNGKIVIVKNGKTYSVSGVEIK